MISSRFSSIPKRRRSVEADRAFETIFQKIKSGSWRLLDISCVCGSRDFTDPISKVDRYGFELKTRICKSCASLVISPYLNQAEVDVLYKNFYTTLYERALNPKDYIYEQRKYGKRLLETLEHLLPASGKILEVGCGAGGGLAPFKEQGHTVVGCDHSKELVDFGKSHFNINLVNGDVECVNEKNFDLIFLHHVLEHIRRPEILIQKLSTLINSKGLIVVSVPDYQGIWNGDFDNFNIMEMFHIAHPYNFTSKGLKSVKLDSKLLGKRFLPSSKTQTVWQAALPELWFAWGISSVIEQLPPCAAIETTDHSKCLELLQRHEKAWIRKRRLNKIKRRLKKKFRNLKNFFR